MPKLTLLKLHIYPFSGIISLHAIPQCVHAANLAQRKWLPIWPTFPGLSHNELLLHAAFIPPLGRYQLFCTEEKLEFKETNAHKLDCSYVDKLNPDLSVCILTQETSQPTADRSQSSCLCCFPHPGCASAHRHSSTPSLMKCISQSSLCCPQSCELLFVFVTFLVAL